MPGSVAQPIVWSVVGNIPRAAGQQQPEGFAKLTTMLDGTNNDLVFTALEKGSAGREISIEYGDPAAQATTGVQVTGKAIKVTPGLHAEVEVTDAGTAAVNGVYHYVGQRNGKANWSHSGYPLVDARVDWIDIGGGLWMISEADTLMYSSASAADFPNSLEWTVEDGAEPAPDVETHGSVANQVKAAIGSNEEASALVTVANAPGNDGTGAVSAMTARRLG